MAAVNHSLSNINHCYLPSLNCAASALAPPSSDLFLDPELVSIITNCNQWKMICDEHVKITRLMLASRLHYAYNDPLNDKNLDLSLMSQMLDGAKSNNLRRNSIQSPHTLSIS